MAAVTLTTLRTRARERADMVNSGFVADTATSLDAWLNEGCQELHEFLARLYGNEYEGKTYAFSTVAGQDTYDLPGDFYKLLALDVTLSGESVDVPRFNLKERNRHRSSSSTSWSAFGAPRYRIVGKKLYLYPTADGAYSMTLWYVPQLQVKSAATLTFNQVASTSDTVLIDGVTITASNSLSAGTYDTATNSFSRAGTAAQNATALSGLIVAMHDNGTLLYATAVLASPVVYIIGATTITFGGTNLGLGLAAYVPYVASFTRNQLVGAYDSVDLPDGLERYIPIYAAIQALKKEESDSRPLEAELGSLREHITAALAPRDAGEPDSAVYVEDY